MATFAIPADDTPPSATHDDGVIKNIMDGFRSIPHFGNAISRGVDEPGISEDERAMRKRSLSEAATWVLPILVGGGTGLFLKGLSNPAIRFAIQGALGNAAGAGVASAVNDGTTEDITKSALLGGAIGGAAGFAGGAFHAGKVASTALAGEDEAAALAAKSQETLSASDKVIGQLGSKVGRHPEGGVMLSHEPIPTGQIKPPTTKFGLDSPGIQQNIDLPIPRSKTQQELFPQLTPLLQEGDRYAVPPTYTGKLGNVDPAMEQQVLGSLDSPKVGEQLNFSFITTNKAAPKSLQQDMFGAPSRAELTKLVGPEGAATAVDSQIAQELTGIPANALLTKNVGPPATPFKKITTKSGINIVELPEDMSTFAPDQHLSSVTDATARSLTSSVLFKHGKDVLAPIFSDLRNIVMSAVRPSRILLQSFGETGTKLAAKIDVAMENWRAVAGPELSEVSDILKNFRNVKDRVHIGEVMEGLAKARAPEHDVAATKLAEIFSRIHSRATELGIREIGPGGNPQAMGKITNYLTHYVDDAALTRMTTPGTREYKAAIAKVMKAHAYYTPEQAAATLKLYSKHPAEFRTGPINFARTLDLPYEKDPAKIVSRYVYTVRRRLAFAEQFGGDSKGVLPFYAGIGNDVAPEEAKRAMAQANRIFNAANETLPSTHAKVVQAASVWNIMTMLSTSGIVQPAQLFNPAALVGYGNLVKAIRLATTRGGVKFAENTGGHISEVLQDMIGGAYSTSALQAAGQKFVKVIGLEPLDKYNRVVSALAGRLHAEEVAQKFMKMPNNRVLSDKLIKLGINPSDVLATKGILNSEQLLSAGRKVSLNTQFASDVLDLPLYRNGDLGRLLYQFKSFGLQQTEFIARELIRPLKHGDAGPMLRWAGGVGAAGAGIGPIIRGLKGYEKPDNAAMEQVENLAYAGAWGMMYDSYKALAGGPGAFTSMLVGPSGGELAQFLAGDLPAAAQGKPEVVAKHLIKRIPIIGQPLANYWLFPK